MTRLAYAHQYGVVLLDTIQKCVIMSATLNDLYGGPSIMHNNRDISIQPFATSSILQHHYQATRTVAGNASLPLTDAGPNTASNHNNSGADNCLSVATQPKQRTVSETSNVSKPEPSDDGASAFSSQKSALLSGNSCDSSVLCSQVSKATFNHDPHPFPATHRIASGSSNQWQRQLQLKRQNDDDNNNSFGISDSEHIVGFISTTRLMFALVPCSIMLVSLCIQKGSLMAIPLENVYIFKTT